MLADHRQDADLTELVGLDSAKALIREARRRARRRRLALMGGIAFAIGVATVAYAAWPGGGSAVVGGRPPKPLVNLRGFAGHGNLAFVSRDRLWVLSGTGHLRGLPTARHQVALSPTFSHDGRWLAYLTQSTGPDAPSVDQLWIARADGSRARAVGRVDNLVGWSPRADTVAVTVGRQTKDPPYGGATALDLVSPTGTERTVVQAPSKPRTPGGVDAILSSVWSPDGSALGVALGGGQAAIIESVPVAQGARPSLWFATHGSAVPVSGLPGRVPSEVIPDLAGWWPGWGIAFWIDDFGGVRNPDSTPLVAIARPRAQPRRVADTLSTGITDAVAPGAGDQLALVASSRTAGREFGDGKLVQSCRPRTGCRAIPAATVWSGPNGESCDPCFPLPPRSGEPGSGVSEDPAWSPQGSTLAYVKAPVVGTGADPSDAWFADHAIYIWNPTTGTTKRVGTVNGAAVPTWSGDGRDLLYESDNGLWLMPVAIGRPVEIAHPLYSPAEWNARTGHLASVSFYGQIPWDRQFSWSSR